MHNSYYHKVPLLLPTVHYFENDFLIFDLKLLLYEIAMEL